MSGFLPVAPVSRSQRDAEADDARAQKLAGEFGRLLEGRREALVRMSSARSESGMTGSGGHTATPEPGGHHSDARSGSAARRSLPDVARSEHAASGERNSGEVRSESVDRGRQPGAARGGPSTGTAHSGEPPGTGAGAPVTSSSAERTAKGTLSGAGSALRDTVELEPAQTGVARSATEIRGAVEASVDREASDTAITVESNDHERETDANLAERASEQGSQRVTDAARDPGADSASLSAESMCRQTADWFARPLQDDGPHPEPSTATNTAPVSRETVAEMARLLAEQIAADEREGGTSGSASWHFSLVDEQGSAESGFVVTRQADGQLTVALDPTAEAQDAAMRDELVVRLAQIDERIVLESAGE